MTNWLTLKNAAEMLNVHTSTLRRWADKGDIPVLVTPGGHRRFSLEDITTFRDQRHGRRSRQSVEEAWSEHALTRTRNELQMPGQQDWMTHIDDEGRVAHRHLGRQLMGLTLQFLSSQGEEERFLAEARVVGEAYGRLTFSQGLPLEESLEAMLFFRDTMQEVALELPSAMKVRPQTTVQLVRRLNRLLNEVHLAVAKYYQESQPLK